MLPLHHPSNCYHCILLIRHNQSVSSEPCVRVTTLQGHKLVFDSNTEPPPFFKRAIAIPQLHSFCSPFIILISIIRGGGVMECGEQVEQHCCNQQHVNDIFQMQLWTGNSCRVNNKLQLSTCFMQFNLQAATSRHGCPFQVFERVQHSCEPVSITSQLHLVNYIHIYWCKSYRMKDSKIKWNHNSS